MYKRVIFLTIQTRFHTFSCFLKALWEKNDPLKMTFTFCKKWEARKPGNYTVDGNHRGGGQKLGHGQTLIADYPIHIISTKYEAQSVLYRFIKN